ncbi:hypothetical protein WJX75_001043 [Coccomyxa subellipsoidea]|uniref:Uncharacterized protein n=1 Tax=Coccomyxa subellipsoidea TaxID=248742 RepID=A0ABR2YLV0_9CHLO
MSGLIVASALRSEETDLGRRNLQESNIVKPSTGETINKGNVRLNTGFTAAQSTARIAGVTMVKGGTAGSGSLNGSNLRKRSHSAKKSARLF